MQDQPNTNLKIATGNLPTYFNSFIGRDHEFAEIKKILEETPLLTLTGTGGVGKTRLAVQFARTALAESYFQDDVGIGFVELALLTDERYLLETIIQALDIKDSSGQFLQLQQVLLNFLQNKKLILILDNCEHVLTACAHLAALLLAKCPGLKIIATSREALGIDGEVTFRVPSLATAVLNNHSDLNASLESEAVRLFFDRARAADPGFSLSEKNLPFVVEICNRLDGIPLALELAAARLRTMPLGQIAARLDDRFRLLTGGSRVSLPRQQTLRALVDWSYNLLEVKEQVLLRRLTVFTGNWSIESAEDICQDQYPGPHAVVEITRDEVLGLVLQLVNKSLVQLDRTLGRYYLLETIRQYAREKFTGSGEAETYLNRYRAWYLQFARQAQKELSGPDQLAWKKRIAQEHAELRTVLDWFLSQGKLVEAASIVVGLSNFWLNWHFTVGLETRALLEKIYTLSEQSELPPEIRVRVYNVLGIAYHSEGNFSKAKFYHNNALQLWRELGDKASTAKALLDMGWFHQFQMNLTQVEHYAKESLALAREIGDKRAIAAALHLQAIFLICSNRASNAKPVIDEGLKIWRELGDLESIASCSLMLAQSEMTLGDFHHARRLVAEAFSMLLEMENIIGVGIAFTVMARLVLGTNMTIENARKSATLLGIANQWYEELLSFGTKRPEMVLGLEEPLVKELNKILGKDGYSREYTVGTKLSREETLKLALALIKPGELENGSGPALPLSFPNGLTGREVDVLRLVAAGYSNPVIAEKLVLSRRTVEAHLRSIFNKLEITSRSEAASFAVEHHLL